MISTHKEGCLGILRELQQSRYRDKVVFFSSPVVEWFDLTSEEGRAGWEEYSNEIKEPRDLRTIEEKLKNDGYPSIASFNSDVTLCFNNAKHFNRKRNKVIYDCAVSMMKVFQNKMQKMITVASGAKSATNTSSATASTTTSKKSSLKNENSTLFDKENADYIMKVLSNLKSSSWFMDPIDTTLPLYTQRISCPMDFLKIKEKIQRKEYMSMEEFSRDVRRCFGNCLVYNYQLISADHNVKKLTQSIRKDARTTLFRFEEEWMKLYGHRGISPALPELKDILSALEEGLKVVSTFLKGVPAIEAFMSPVSLYYVDDPGHMKKYNSIISKPMDYGHIFSSLVEAQYSSTEDVIKDCTLVADNCAEFYAAQHNVFIEVAKQKDDITIDAYKVLEKITKELDKIRSKRINHIPEKVSKSVRSPLPNNNQTERNINKSGHIQKEDTVKKKEEHHFNVKEKYLWCLAELKAHTLDNGIQTSWPFLRAVDTKEYTDYFEVVSTAMDLSLMEKKVNRDRYPNMLSIWKDMELIRDNCHAYSKYKGFADLGFLADKTSEVFKYLLKIVAEEAMVGGTGEGSLYRHLLPSPESEDIIVNSKTSSDIISFYDSKLKKSPNEEVSRETQEMPIAKEKPVRLARVSQRKAENSPNEREAYSAESDNDVIEDEENEYIDEELPREHQSVSPVYQNSGIASKGAASKKASHPPACTTKDTDESGIERDEWELQCYEFLKKICKHEFVDTSKGGKSGQVVVDFFHPVVELFPSIREAYLEKISQPMDFSTIYNRLNMRGYLDAEDVFLKVLLIFQNSIEYNSPGISENEYLRSVVVRCEHMIKYVTWLAHEVLPCIDDTSKDEGEREAMGSLRVSLRDKYRQERMAIIENSPILFSGRECYALIRKFEFRKYNKEMCYFIYPVEVSLLADYSIHVRHPMCFQTLKENLESSFTDTGESSGKGYHTYGEFLKDLRLIFKNAKTYCAVHMEADEVSRTIYDAAVMLSELLETWVWKEFSVDVAEKILLWRIKEEERIAEEAKAEEERRLAAEQDEAYRKEQLEYLLKVDPVFAADQLKRQSSFGALNVQKKTLSGHSAIDVKEPSRAEVDIDSPEAKKPKKRKRLDEEDHLASESEGEEYVDEENDSNNEEAFHEKERNKKKRPKVSTAVEPMEESESGEAMDVFDQYEVSEAMRKKQEEIVKSRLEGDGVVTAPVSAKSDGAEQSNVQYKLRAEGRRRAREAIWESLSLRDSSSLEQIEGEVDEKGDSTVGTEPTPHLEPNKESTSAAKHDANVSSKSHGGIRTKWNQKKSKSKRKPLQVVELPPRIAGYFSRTSELDEQENHCQESNRQDALPLPEASVRGKVCETRQAESYRHPSEDVEHEKQEETRRVVLLKVKQNSKRRNSIQPNESDSPQLYLSIPDFISLKGNRCIPETLCHEIQWVSDTGRTKSFGQIVQQRFTLNSGAVFIRILFPEDDHVGCLEVGEPAPIQQDSFTSMPMMANGAGMLNNVNEGPSLSSEPISSSVTHPNNEQLPGPSSFLSAEESIEGPALESTRSRSSSTGSPPMLSRRRSSSFTFRPQSRQREKFLKRNLSYVEEVLKFYDAVKRQRHTERPLQFMLQSVGGGNSNVNISPPRKSSFAEVSACRNGLTVGYFENGIHFDMRQCEAYEDSTLQRFLRDDDHCASFRDFFCCSNDSSHGQSKITISKQSDGVTSCHSTPEYSVTGALPFGDVFSSSMIAATSGLLVSRDAEKIRYISNYQVDEGGMMNQYTYRQVWLLVAEPSSMSVGLSMDVPL